MKKLQHLLEYILAQIWLNFVAILPLKYATHITAKIFIFIGRKLKASKIAAQNIKKIFPEFSDAKVDNIVTEVWSNLGSIVAETPYLLSLPEKEFNKYVVLKGEGNLKKVIGKRVIFCSAHLANWELMGKALAPFNIRLNGVYRVPNNKLINDLINKLRYKYVIGNLFPKGKIGAKLIVKAIQNNEAVYMLVDQRMDDGIKVPFLGFDAMTAPAIAALAIKYDCPIIPIQVIRKKDSHFEIVFHPIINHHKKDIKTIMTEINEMIGEWVKQNPGQWFWLHRRWGK